MFSFEKATGIANRAPIAYLSIISGAYAGDMEHDGAVKRTKSTVVSTYFSYFDAPWRVCRVQISIIFQLVGIVIEVEIRAFAGLIETSLETRRPVAIKSDLYRSTVHENILVKSISSRMTGYINFSLIKQRKSNNVQILS